MEFLKKHKKKIIIIFWIFWALTIATAYSVGNFTDDYSMIGLYLFLGSFAVFPIVGLILLAILPKKQPTKPIKPTPTEAEVRAQQEKELMERLMNEEKGKKEMEKYKMKKIGKWIVLPLLLSFILGVIFLWYWYSTKEFNWYFALVVAACFFPIFATDIETEWDKRMECKRQITGHYDLEEEGVDNDLSRYDWDYIYTNSSYQFYLYNTACQVFITRKFWFIQLDYVSCFYVYDFC